MLQCLDENKPVEAINLKDAVFMMAKAGDNVSITTISNCWNKAGFPDDIEYRAKRMQTNFATFRRNITKFRSKFIEFSKRLLFQSKRKFEGPREFSNEISLRRSEISTEISRLLIESSQRKFVF